MIISNGIHLNNINVDFSKINYNNNSEYKLIGLIRGCIYYYNDIIKNVFQVTKILNFFIIIIIVFICIYIPTRIIIIMQSISTNLSRLTIHCVSVA